MRRVARWRAGHGMTGRSPLSEDEGEQQREGQTGPLPHGTVSFRAAVPVGDGELSRVGLAQGP